MVLSGIYRPASACFGVINLADVLYFFVRCDLICHLFFMANIVQLCFSSVVDLGPPTKPGAQWYWPRALVEFESVSG